MKTALTYLLLTLIFSTSRAQQKLPTTDKYGEPLNYMVGARHSKIPIFLSTDAQTKSIHPFNTVPNDPLGTWVYLVDATRVSLTTEVKKDSLSYYRYSVFENDTTVVQSNALLSKIDFVWPKGSDLPGYMTMNFGISNIQDKKITVKIYRLPEVNKVTTVVIYNKAIKAPRLESTSLIYQGRPLRFHIAESSINMPFIRVFNKVKPLKNGSKLNVDPKTRGIELVIKQTDLDFIYHVILKKKAGPEDQIVFLSNNWSYQRNNKDLLNFIPASYFSDPGTYELIVRPIIGQSSKLRAINSGKALLTFSVVKPAVAFGVFEVAISLMTLMVIILVVYLLIRRNNMRKLHIANRQAEIANTELENVRSRLSPHFVFNALTGIQNLMNRNEVEKANSYLSKFARLTRNILNGQQLIALKDEHKLLEDYLSMEQLRFNFNYEIHPDIGTEELEVMIPSMLLQPFLENAVKHSMSIMGDKGILRIEFKSVQKDLILLVKDNGEGFNVQQEHEGLGLSLCKKRINLLNQIYQECPILLEISSGQRGTTVIITLTNWL